MSRDVEIADSCAEETDRKSLILRSPISIGCMNRTASAGYQSVQHEMSRPDMVYFWRIAIPVEDSAPK